MSRNFLTGKYKLSKAEYLSAKYFALRFDEFVDEYNSLKDSVTAITVNGLPYGTDISNPTEMLAIRRDRLKRKINIITGTAKEVSIEYSEQILLRATKVKSYEYLHLHKELYVSKRTFQRMMREYYYLLSKRI